MLPAPWMLTPAGTDIPMSPAASPPSRGAFNVTCPHAPRAHVTPVAAATLITGAGNVAEAGAMLSVPLTVDSVTAAVFCQ